MGKIERMTVNDIPRPRSREDLLDMIAEGEKGPFLDGPTVLAELRAKYRLGPE